MKYLPDLLEVEDDEVAVVIQHRESLDVSHTSLLSYQDHLGTSIHHILQLLHSTQLSILLDL